MEENMLRRIVSYMKLISLKKYLELVHVCGLLSLPDYNNKDPKKIQKQKLYKICNLTFLTLSLTGFGINLFIRTIRNTPLFVENLLILGIVGITFGTLCMMQINLKMFMQILDFFETTARLHRDNKAVCRLQNMERKYIQAALLTIIVGVILHIIVAPLIPKSSKELETLSKLYNWEYPQNTLAFPVYLPFIDQSEFIVYFFSHGLEIYGAFLLSLVIVLTILIYPLSVLHLKCHFTILKDFTLLIGKPHFTSCGQPIFYTNLLENKKVIRRFHEKQLEPPMVEQDKHLSHWFERHPDLYDAFYLREIILFQKTLILQRERLDEYFADKFSFFALMAMIVLTISMYGSLIPIGATTLARTKMTIEAITTLSFMYLYFYCGELLAGCNESLALGLWQSQWYTCSTKTLRDMLVFLRMNQKLNYNGFGYVFTISYKTMQNGLNFGYSVLNVLRMRKQISQF